MRSRAVVRMLLLAVVAPALASCDDAAAPAALDLSGTWTIVDTTYNAYTAAFDGSQRVRAWINSMSLDFSRTSDSTWIYHALPGSIQTVFDTVSGQGATPEERSMIALHADALVRGDTAYVTYLGKIALPTVAAGDIRFRRVLPVPECLDALGGLAKTAPAPVCTEAHHWTPWVRPVPGYQLTRSAGPF